MLLRAQILIPVQQIHGVQETNPIRSIFQLAQEPILQKILRTSKAQVPIPKIQLQVHCKYFQKNESHLCQKNGSVLWSSWSKQNLEKTRILSGARRQGVLLRSDQNDIRDCPTTKDADGPSDFLQEQETQDLAVHPTKNFHGLQQAQENSRSDSRLTDARFTTEAHIIRFPQEQLVQGKKTQTDCLETNQKNEPGRKVIRPANFTKKFLGRPKPIKDGI